MSFVSAWMNIEGDQQGTITEGVGSSSHGVEGHEDEIWVHNYRHNIDYAETDVVGWGARVHKPLMVTKLFDKATPLLYGALCNGETLTVKLVFNRLSYGGDQEKVYTIELKRAHIVKIEPELQFQDASADKYLYKEAIYFRYGEISWTHEEFGTTFVDTWNSSDD